VVGRGAGRGAGDGAAGFEGRGGGGLWGWLRRGKVAAAVRCATGRSNICECMGY
jgi:hypothetical protein